MTDSEKLVLKEVAEIEEEIEWISIRATIPESTKQAYKDRGWEFSAGFIHSTSIAARILSRLTEALAAKKQGMRSKEEK